MLLNLRGEPRSTAPVILPEPKVISKKPTEESTCPKPVVVIKKKPVVVAKPPTPTNEARPLKVNFSLLVFIYLH